MSIIFSIVICTYNRSDKLVRALISLVQQSMDKRLYEIIIVDNGSTDLTREVAENFEAMHRECNIAVMREDRLGLGYARNAGYRQSKGAYVAFMDDDARADRNWLEVALDRFDHVKPTPLVVGGPILPFYQSSKPLWFKEEYEIRTWGHEPRFLERGESFSGSNMIFRREAIEKHGGFDVKAGVKGEYLSVGEETSLFEEILEHNGKVGVLYYSPRLLVFHEVPDYKMTVSYQLKRAFVTGQAWYLRHGPKSFLKRLQLVLRVMFSIAKFSGSSLAHSWAYPRYQNWVVESWAPISAEIGRFIGCLGFHIPVKQR